MSIETPPLEEDPLGSVSRSQLHFFWIADCSGSMRTQGKIQVLNNAIHECVPATREANENNAFETNIAGSSDQLTISIFSP